MAYSVCGQPLRFIHFSHIDSGKDQEKYFRRYAPLGCEPIHALRRDYVRFVDAIRTEVGAHDAWSYDVFRSGERISIDARFACRVQPELIEVGVDPFVKSNDYFFSR